MVKPQSSRKLIIVSILSILIVSVLTFGTLAFFRQTDTATGIIGMGSTINFDVTNNSVQTTNLTGTFAVGSTVEKKSGVNAKLRVFVNVALYDSSDNIVSATDDLGNAYYSVTMGTVSGAQWVLDTDSNVPQKATIRQCWQYLMSSSNSSTAFVVPNSQLTICASVTFNAGLSAVASKAIITTSVEMVQFNNVAWIN